MIWNWFGMRGDADSGNLDKDANDRRLVLLGVLLTIVVLSYFYVTDNYYFSTRYMTPIFQYLLMLNDSKTAWLSLGVCILAACWRHPAPITKIIEWFAEHEMWVIAAAIVLLSLSAKFVYRDNAFSMDEYAAVFQAKLFASGRLTAHLPPSVVDWLLPPGFNGSFLVASRATGEAMEGYWPGFALLLAPFEFLGMPWLCNASLGGLSIFLIYRITLEITNDRRAAGWAMLFTVGSGAFVANAISFYSMQAHLTCNLVFVWLLSKPTLYRAFGAGVVGSFALVLHNPFPHALFAVPWIIASLRSQQPSRIIPLALGYLPVLLIVGAGWLYLRDLVTRGDTAFNVIGNTVSAAFSLPDKPIIDMRVAGLVKMWVWAVPCLFLFAVVGRVRWASDQRVRLLTQSAALTFAGYIMFIFDQGHGWGYRYFYSAWGVVPILAGCAMVGRIGTQDRLFTFAGTATLFSLVLIVPYQLVQIHDVIGRHLAQLPPPYRPGNNVYFVSERAGGFYLGDLVQMDPLLRAEDLILFSAGPEKDAELRQQNWPNAILVGRSFGVEEWNLGPMDQRRASEAHSVVRHFELDYRRIASAPN